MTSAIAKAVNHGCDENSPSRVSTMVATDAAHAVVIGLIRMAAITQTEVVNSCQLLINNTHACAYFFSLCLPCITIYIISTPLIPHPHPHTCEPFGHCQPSCSAALGSSRTQTHCTSFPTANFHDSLLRESYSCRQVKPSPWQSMQ